VLAFPIVAGDVGDRHERVERDVRAATSLRVRGIELDEMDPMGGPGAMRLGVFHVGTVDGHAVSELLVNRPSRTDLPVSPRRSR
jgi:hypothetical protein